MSAWVKWLLVVVGWSEWLPVVAAWVSWLPVVAALVKWLFALVASDGFCMIPKELLGCFAGIIFLIF